MVKLTDESIAEFQALFKAETGKNITPEQAREYAERLIGLVDIVVNLQPPSRHERGE
jgi:hypothetical protein